MDQSLIFVVNPCFHDTSRQVSVATLFVRGDPATPGSILSSGGSPRSVMSYGETEIDWDLFISCLSGKLRLEKLGVEGSDCIHPCMVSSAVQGDS